MRLLLHEKYFFILVSLDVQFYFPFGENYWGQVEEEFKFDFQFMLYHIQKRTANLAVNIFFFFGVEGAERIS